MALVLVVGAQPSSLEVAIMPSALSSTLLSHVSEIGAFSVSCFRSTRLETIPRSVVSSLITFSKIVDH